MLFHISSYSLVYLAAGVVTLFTTSLAWKRRTASRGMWLFLAAGEWSMADVWFWPKKRIFSNPMD